MTEEREEAHAAVEQDKAERKDLSRPKRFLCVCEGGCVRSAALAWQLKVRHGQNAIAGSWKWNDQETLAMLCEWADYVVVMQAEFASRIPAGFGSKLRAVDVGVDRYGTPVNMELAEFLAKVVDGWAKRGFDI